MSPKTVENLAKRGRLAAAKPSRLEEGKPPMVLYCPEDVEREKQRRLQVAVAAVISQEDMNTVTGQSSNADTSPSNPPPDSEEKFWADVTARRRAKWANSHLAQAEALVVSPEKGLSKRAAAILGPTRAIVGPQDKLYLTLDEAVQYSGLPKAFLKGLLTEGKLTAVVVGKSGNGLKRRIKRADLEGLTLD